MTSALCPAVRAAYEIGVSSENPFIRAISAVSLASIETSMAVPAADQGPSLATALVAIIDAAERLAPVPGVPHAARKALQTAYEALAALGLHSTDTVQSSIRTPNRPTGEDA